MNFPDLNPAYQDSKKIIAYSGGVDSHVLLHHMAASKHASLSAIHINHGLHKDADQWQEHCRRVCDALGVPFKSIKINIVKKPRHSLEALAREARYEALDNYVDEDTILLTGHNQNDQAETVLLQLMRGAGIKGLSGMPAEKPFSKGKLIRPLLSITRAEIEAYARLHQLQWINDPSNAQDDFDRNFLRNQIFPALETRRDNIIKNMARSAELIAQASELLETLAARDYETVKGRHKHALNIEALKQLDDTRQIHAIRYWLSLLGVRLPSQAILKQIKQQLLYSYPGAKPVVRFATVELTRDPVNRGELLLTLITDTPL